MTGILIKQISGFYYVEAGNTVYECKARGAFRKNGQSPVAGDMVKISMAESDKGVVTEILPRKNKLIRPPLANIDKLFIVSSYKTPAVNNTMIDKLIAIAENKNIEPLIVFNKSDLGDLDDWYNIYRKSGFKTFVLSVKASDGMMELREELSGFVSAFTGNTGVGKSSILNMLLPDLKLQTGEVSERLGRGRHTTRQVELFKLPEGGYVADTPGFSSLDIEKAEIVLKDQLVFAFREFESYLGMCKFTSCSHTKEKGCAIRVAVDSGNIEKSRYESYLSMYNDVKDINEWEINR